MKINIDDSAGFCWGVVRTIDMAEEELQKDKAENVYVLGQIIHNPRETERLENKGLKIISHDDLDSISDENAKVIVRAHGEPPSTYQKAEENGLNLVDATCPLVTSLQKRIKKYHDKGFQIVIYGKREHPEIVGIRGFVNEDCIVIRTKEEAIERVDFTKKTAVFSQTTMHREAYKEIKDFLGERISEVIDGGDLKDHYQAKNSICKAVADRYGHLEEFSKQNDAVLFIAGRSSSNGKALYKVCRAVNECTYFIEDSEEIDYSWFDGVESLGVTGATSTPQWYLKQVAKEIEKNMEPVA